MAGLLRGEYSICEAKGEASLPLLRVIERRVFLLVCDEKNRDDLSMRNVEAVPVQRQP
jgi:hypothetical protein